MTENNLKIIYLTRAAVQIMTLFKYNQDKDLVTIQSDMHSRYLNEVLEGSFCSKHVQPKYKLPLCCSKEYYIYIMNSLMPEIIIHKKSTAMNTTV